ncbi:MAG: hypothetical protein PHC97_02825 [Patescibacteria group bacterium]|nr:hypothetical protein [Patescibacteria group bacterium]
MKNTGKNLIIFFLALAVIIFPNLSKAQAADDLLHEYILPISSYQDLGTVVAKKGAECDTAILYDNLGTGSPTNCAALSQSGDIKKADSVNNYLEVDKPAVVSYRFNIKEAGNYIFKIQTANLADNFSNFSNQEIDYLLQGANIRNFIKENDGLDSSFDQYALARSLIFSVYVNGQRKGYVIVPDTDFATQIQTGIVEIGNLQPGDQQIELRFLNDYNLDFSGLTLPDYFNNFLNVDLDRNKILDVNPIIFTAAVDSILPIEDVIGIRIYSNNENKYPADWYRDNVLNPNSNPENVMVDGYQGVLDGRTVYVSAANVDINTGKIYTNIYVIAYNENAAPATTEIYKLMLANFNFNTNLQVFYPGDYVKKKDQLRRDTIRKADVNRLNQLLASYRQKNGSFPAMSAGTFVPGHTISTWPSWQANLGNALGFGLPADPLNYMSTTIFQNDCTGSNSTSENCANVCSRDASSNPLTGCPANQQCVDGQFCSICPPGYDALTCWDQNNLRFAFETYNSQNCSNTNLLGAFNLGGSVPCSYDGSFVYQYTALNGGKAYLLNYRLEYQTSETCRPGQCFNSENGQCYNPGQCVDPIAHSYCLAGSLLSSCGDGFLQSDCGEECDGKLGSSNLCADSFGNHNFYTPVSGTCSSDCKIQSNTGLTPADCGGYCGDAIIQRDHGETCDNTSAYCVNCRCLPNCQGRCGGADDGCGGKCTANCGSGQVCSTNGNCVPQDCSLVCSGKCGIVSTCDCGGCVTGQDCVKNTCTVSAEPPCVVNCNGKKCGTDNCGNENGCGICGIGKKCDGASGQCVSDCASTCVPYNLESKIYPCGYDGCTNRYGCFYLTEENKYNTTNTATDCQTDYKLGGSAWTCNQFLGRCTCELSPTDPRSCLDRCSGYDGCGRICGVSGQCKEGPCNTNGLVKPGADKSTLNRCLTCSNYCQIWKGEGGSSSCYDYKIVTVPPFDFVDTDGTGYPVTVYVPNNIVSTGIRFVDKDDRIKFFPYFVDVNGLDAVKSNAPAGYSKVLVKIPPGTQEMHMIYNVNQNVAARIAAGGSADAPPETNSATSVFELWDDFNGTLDTSKWTIQQGDGASVRIEGGKLLISGQDTSANNDRFFGVTNGKVMQNNTLVKVDFAESTADGFVSGNWKSTMGLSGLSLNAERQEFCCWNGHGLCGGAIQCWTSVVNNGGSTNRYVSRWASSGGCGGKPTWWVCEKKSNFQNYTGLQAATIYTMLDNNGKLVYSEKNLNDPSRTVVDSPGSQTVSLLFGPDEYGRQFSASFDNLVARKYIESEPVATLSNPSGTNCPSQTAIPLP